MTGRIRFNEEGEAILPRELLEDEFVEEGTILKAHRDERGNVVLKRLARQPVREYSEEELAMFAEEDEMTPAERDRFLASLGREPRLFGR
jgi:hypothetical protein